VELGEPGAYRTCHDGPTEVAHGSEGSDVSKDSRLRGPLRIALIASTVAFAE
jgi:hypothetical protein